MRFGYVVSQYPARSETFIAREMQELVDQGHTVELIRLRWSDTGEGEEVSGAHVSPVLLSPGPVARGLVWALTQNPAGAFKTLSDLLRARAGVDLTVRLIGVWLVCLAALAWLSDREIDHFRAHFFDVESVGAWLLARLLDRPFSITAQTTVRRLPDPLVRQIVQQASLGVATTSETRRFLDEWRPGRPVETVRSGLPLASVPRRPQRHVRSPMRVLAVGRLVPKKGFDLLLDASGRLLQEGADLRVDLFGDGPERQALEAQIRRCGMQEDIMLHGAVPYREVQQAYANADVLVMPSRPDPVTNDRDGLPNVVIEAAAAGCPVIATPIGGIPDLVRERSTGRLVPVDDIRALAAALKETIRNYEASLAWAEEARREVFERYDLSREVAKLIRAIRSASDH